MDEEIGSTNSEMRFIAIELMKIASRKNATFEEVSEEFIRNVYSLEKLVNERGEQKHIQSREIPARKQENKE